MSPAVEASCQVDPLPKATRGGPTESGKQAPGSSLPNFSLLSFPETRISKSKS